MRMSGLTVWSGTAEVTSGVGVAMLLVELALFLAAGDPSAGEVGFDMEGSFQERAAVRARVMCRWDGPILT
jgi:hypothetical protein